MRQTPISGGHAHRKLAIPPLTTGEFSIGTFGEFSSGSHTLKAGAWVRRDRFVMVPPELAASLPLSGWKSTYRPVQISLAGSVQAQVLKMLHDLRLATRLSYLVITHDFAVVRDICHRVVVLDAGRLVETGSVDDVLDRSTNETTQSLLENVLPLPFAPQPASMRVASGADNRR